MRIVRFIDRYFEEILSAVLLAVMTIIVAIQIVLRIAGLPLSWSEELARYMFIWLIYIGSAYAIKRRSHIKVEIVTLLVKEDKRYILDIISDIGFFIFGIVIGYFSWIATYKIAFVNVQKSPSLHLNMGLAYLSVSLGFTLMVIRLIQDIVKIIKERKAAKAEKEN